MIVYTVGTFDLLHVGHLALLNHCKLLGDILVVGVASDAVVKMYKPNVPIVPLEQRVEMLEALSCVDIVRPYYQLEYVSGCKEVVIQNKNGILIPLKNAPAIEKAISKILSNNKKLKYMEKNSRKKALLEFDEKFVVKKYLNCYQKII